MSWSTEFLTLMTRFIVTYGPPKVTDNFRALLDKDQRLESGDKFRAWSEKDLPAWVNPKQRPFSQVAYILDQALIQQADFVLWLCPEVKVVKSLEPLWQLLDSKTAWFVSTGQSCKIDPVVNECLGMNGENVPEVTTQAFGLDFRMPPTLRFLVELKKCAKDSRLDNASHDQFAYLFSALVWRYKLNVEEPNHFLAFHKDNDVVLPESAVVGFDALSCR